MFGFIKVTATSANGKYKAMVAVEHIAAVMEVGTGGAQILLKGGDFLPVVDDFEDVEMAVKKAQGGSGHTVFA